MTSNNNLLRMFRTEKVRLVLLYSGFIIAIIGLANVMWIAKKAMLDNTNTYFSFTDFIPLISGICIMLIPMFLPQGESNDINKIQKESTK